MEKENETSYISRTSGLKSKDYIGYAMIDTGGCLVFSLVTTLLQKFYTDIFCLSPLFIMFMFVAARVWDAVNDPMMGRIAALREKYDLHMKVERFTSDDSLPENDMKFIKR